MNFTRILLLLCALSFFCSCDTQKRDIQTGEDAPLFSVADISGDLVSLTQLKGKIVVLYFWKNSCCGDSLKLLEPFYEANRHKKLAIIAINIGDTKEVVTSYATNNGLTFTMLADEHSGIFEQYQVFGFPTIFIIDKNGVIRNKILGNIQVDQLETVIQRQFALQKQAETSYEKNHPRK
ncbi:peroxiredoxin [Geobacter sp. OR-1]|uniref:peroxiredoxin family protein n=1 Tax=Geobacter sp. OR-1 TaxID=1266765 RepID=UPI0005A790D1|nr:TlpA disulfide reductase family protein [Geobacter sp. OR-1]